MSRHVLQEGTLGKCSGASAPIRFWHDRRHVPSLKIVIIVIIVIIIIVVVVVVVVVVAARVSSNSQK